MRRKVFQRMRAGLDATGFIVIAVKMAVAGEHVLHIKAGAVGVALGLFHARQRIFRFPLGFQHGHRQGFGHLAHLHAQQIVGASRPLAATFESGRLHRSRRFQPDALRVVVTFAAQDRIDEVKTGFFFVVGHSRCIGGTEGFTKYP